MLVQMECLRIIDIFQEKGNINRVTITPESDEEIKATENGNNFILTIFNFEDK